jgi:hypothetical protein
MARYMRRMQDTNTPNWEVFVNDKLAGYVWERLISSGRREYQALAPNRVECKPWARYTNKVAAAEAVVAWSARR